jgi:plastocyanin
MRARPTLSLRVLACALAALGSGCDYVYPAITPERAGPDAHVHPPVDAGETDVTEPGDGPALDIPLFHQCTPGMYVDRSAPGAERLVRFGEVATPFAYAPPCMIVAVGQTVTFEGLFSGHPLEPGLSPSMPRAGSPNNPIPATYDGLEARATFTAPGTYPYYCQMHFMTGMTGVIHVR